MFGGILGFGDGRTAATIDRIITPRHRKKRPAAVGDFVDDDPHRASFADIGARGPVNMLPEQAETAKSIFGSVGSGAA